MICKEFEQLTPVEKTNYIGSLVHACESDSELFKLGDDLIRLAIIKGLFDKVVINPNQNLNESNTQ